MLELIVRCVGDIKRLAEEIGFLAEELLGGYAIVRIRQELAPLLLSAEEILWTEVPSRVYTEVANGRRAACVTALQARNPKHVSLFCSILLKNCRHEIRV